MLPLRIRHTSGIAIIGLSMILVLAMAAPVAATKNPPGNNGTVKIDRVEFDDHPNNEPHVGCIFQVDFYGFDADPSYNAEVIFELHPPTAAGRTMSVTSGDLTPFIGEDDNSGGGSQAGLDASETYELAFTGAPHANQGYHLKLTVHAPGSQGADTKHKVFWVTGCDPDVEEPPNPPGGSPPGNPPGGNPPGNPPGGNPPREDTAGGQGGPPILLPDTATPVAGTSPLALVLGAVLVAIAAARMRVAVQRARRR